MSARLAVTGSIMFLVCILGNPAAFSLMPETAQAANVMRIVCSSFNYDYSYCRADARGGVDLTNRLSSAKCKFGKSWGYDDSGVWVDKGCSAEFVVAGAGRKPSSSEAAAVIVGGVVGAILDGGHKHGHHGDNYYPVQRSSRNNQWIDPTPQYDRYGNANFDKRGRYQGCHGSGCLVDNPDYDRWDAPPEPAGRGEQPHFSGGGDPPEPGQSTFQGPDDD